LKAAVCRYFDMTCRC